MDAFPMIERSMKAQWRGLPRSTKRLVNIYWKREDVVPLILTHGYDYELWVVEGGDYRLVLMGLKPG